MDKVRNLAAAVAAGAMLSGCATGPERNPADPLEPMNRAVFTFNDTVDRNVAQPIAKGYQAVTPTPVRSAISNFFANLGDVGNLANNLLQLRITDATEDLMRIAMNSLFGVGGFFDIASVAGLPRHHQDFGLTLARWGIPSGPYLVLPIFGPSSIRDGVGRAVDVRFNLLNYVEPAVRNPMYVTQFVSARADLLGATDLLQQAALDQYSFVRDAYLQQRKSLTYRGEAAPGALPNYGDPGESGGAQAPDGASAPSGATQRGGSPAPGSTPAAPDLPKYDDPGDEAPGGAPAQASAPASAPASASAPGPASASAPAPVPASSAPPASVPATN